MTRLFRNLMLATTALLPLGIGFALAGPNGGTVVGGGATIDGQGSGRVTINQHTNRAIINWYSFNIGWWHIIALNTNCATPGLGGCAAGSPQDAWLQKDLAEHSKSCIVAFGHHALSVAES